VFEPSSHVCGFPALASKVVEIGSNSVNRTTNEIQPVRVHLERLKTCAARPGGPSHSRWSSQCEAVEGVCESQACVFLYAKAKNCVKNLHYKACSFLMSNFDTIILPEFRGRDAEAKQQLDTRVERGSPGAKTLCVPAAAGGQMQAARVDARLF